MTLTSESVNLMSRVPSLPGIAGGRLSRWSQLLPTIAAFAHRSSVGLPYAYPDNNLSYTGNFLNMMLLIKIWSW